MEPCGCLEERLQTKRRAGAKALRPAHAWYVNEEEEECGWSLVSKEEE